MNNKNIIIFFFAGLFSFFTEHQTKSGCKETFKTKLISLLHNYGSIYLVFGSILFGYYLIHLFAVIITVILWKLYSTCFVTKYYNNLCKISSNRPFNDIFFLINKKLKIPYFRHILAVIVSLYDITKIYYN